MQSYYWNYHAQNRIQDIWIWQKQLRYFSRILSDKEVDNNQSDWESRCAICLSPEDDPTNGILFCESCDKGVHALCYGVVEERAEELDRPVSSVGLNSLQEQKASKFKCDICVLKSKEQPLPECKICQKSVGMLKGDPGDMN